MLKLCNMPTLLPDELPHSFMSRVANMNGIRTLEEFIAIFFADTDLAKRKMKSPFNAEELIKPFFESGNITAKEAVNLYENSMFGFASAFSLPPRIIERLTFFFGSGIESFDSKSRIQRLSALYFCPRCMAEEIEEHGFAILHASHQLPGVKVCAKHGTALSLMTGAPNRYDSIKGFEGEAINEISHTDLLYAQFATNFHEARFDICKTDLATTIEDGLAAAGLLNAKSLEEALAEAGLGCHFENGDANRLLKHLTLAWANLIPEKALAALMLCYDDVSALPFNKTTSKPLYRPSVMHCDDCGEEYISNYYADGVGFGCPYCNEKIPIEEVLSRIIHTAADDTFILTGISGNKLNIRHESCGRETTTTLMNFLTSETKCICKRQISEEEFLHRVNENSPTIRIIGRYVGFNKPVRCKCTVCGFEWDAVASDIASGKNCPQIEKHPGYVHPALKDSNEFLEEVRSINPDIIIKSRYEGVNKPIKCECAICGYEWEQDRAGRLLEKNKPCPNIKNHEGYLNPLVKAHPDFCKAVKKIHPHIEIAGTYTGRNNRVDCRCTICGHEWAPVAGNLLEGYGCPNIRQHDDYDNPLKMSTSEFLQKASELNPDFDIISEFKGVDEDITVKCRICGYESTAKANTLLTAQKGCPNYRNHPGYTDPRSRTTAEFIELMQGVNPDIEIIGNYVKSGVPIKCKCRVCGHVWEATPNDLLNYGTGCPNFRNHPGYRNKKLKTTSQFIEELSEVNPNILVLGEYEASNEKIACKCKICGHEWSATASSLLHGHGCPNFRNHPGYRDKRLKTTSQFIEELSEINPNIEVLGEYEASKKKIACKCKICGYEWSAVANSLLHGYGCPNYRKHPK